MRNKLTSVLWGLFLIVIGVGIAGNAFDVWDFHLFFDGWWAFLIIIPCFISMIQSRFGTGSTIGFVIGVILFLSAQPSIGSDVRKLIIPAILVVIGLRILAQNIFGKRPKNLYKSSFTGGKSNSYQGSMRDYNALFSSNKVHMNDINFTGAEINAIFGGVEFDLRDMPGEHDIEINANAIFGGIDIFVPRGMNIKVSNVPIFGGVSNKAGQQYIPGAPTLFINSTCMFGGIDIK